MKPLRILLITLGSLVLLVCVIVALSLSSWVQTWAARRFAPASTALTVSIGQVAAGLQRSRVENIRVIQSGVIFTLPSAEVDINLIDAARDKITVKRLVAHGWSLDLTAPISERSASANIKTAAAPTTTVPGNVPVSMFAPPTPAAEQHTRAAIRGLLASLQLPADLAIEGVDLDGEVILPEGRVHVVITGGGLKAGKEGKWALSADFVGADTTTVKVRGELEARLVSPRDFDRMELALTIEAKSPKAPEGATLAVNLRAERSVQGETYAAVLSTGTRAVVSVDVTLPSGQSPLTGEWKLDVTKADANPFALGHALPDFAAKGHGVFSSDRSLARLSATGTLEAWVDKLGALQPELAALGRLDFGAGFDLSSQNQLVRINRCDLRLNAEGKAVVSMSALQPVEFNRSTGALTAPPSASTELMSLTIDGLPLAWTKPFLGDLSLTGQDLTGAFTVLARNEGLAMRTTRPLTLTNLEVVQRGRKLLTGLDVIVSAQADYTPQGWNGEITQLAINQGQAPLLKLTAKAGQPSGAQQPLTASGTYEVVLPAMLAQPLVDSPVALARGMARGDFSAALGVTKMASLTLQLTDLVAANPAATRLPAVALLARADVDASGKLNAQLPIVITQGARHSEITLTAARQSATGTAPINALISAGTIYLDDLMSFAALSGKAPTDSLTSPKPSLSTPPTPTPLTLGETGTLKIDIKSLVYSRVLQINEINGSLNVKADAVTLEGLRAKLSTGGDFQAAGGLNYDAKQTEPYALKAEVSLVGLESAPLLRALAPGQSSPLEGKFTLTTKLADRAATPTGFGNTAIGDIALSSPNGILRVLTVKTGAQAELVGTAAAMAGLFGTLTGSETTVRKAELVRAAAVVTKQLSAIPYTQFNVVVGRDEQRNLAVKDLTLISPQIRLVGSGQITQKAGVTLYKQPLMLSLKLGAREPLVSSLRTLKLVAESADAQGYTYLLDEVILDGTLQSIGTGQLKCLLDRALAE